MEQNQAALIPAVKSNNPQGWLDAIWAALEDYRENCIPEGDESNDGQWDEIATAMAWISETIEKQEPGELVIIKTVIGKTFPAHRFYSELAANTFMSENDGFGLIYSNGTDSFCVAPNKTVCEIEVTAHCVMEDVSFDEGLKKAKAMGAETYPVLALSTGHMTFKDSQYLDVLANTGSNMVMTRESGYFIKLYAGEDELEMNLNVHYSPFLTRVITFAYESGFELIEFDTDAPVIEEFTVHDW